MCLNLSLTLILAWLKSENCIVTRHQVLIDHRQQHLRNHFKMHPATIILNLLPLLAPTLAIAGPSPDASPEAFHRYCHLPGMGCNKLKRAAEAAAEALAAAEAAPEPSAEPFHRYCHLPGMGCNKAKRSAEALAEAVAKAYAASSPDPAADAEAFQRYW